MNLSTLLFVWSNGYGHGVAQRFSVGSQLFTSRHALTGFLVEFLRLGCTAALFREHHHHNLYYLITAANGQSLVAANGSTGFAFLSIDQHLTVFNGRFSQRAGFKEPCGPDFPPI